MKTIKVKAIAEAKVRKGHPWLHPKELVGHLDGFRPGDSVEIVDSFGDFLCRGYIHPRSRIAFRRMTSDSRFAPFDRDLLFQKFEAAFRLREQAGLLPYSFRLLFAEGDEFPGLVIDRFLTEDSRRQVFVVQCHTAGVERHLDLILSVFESLVEQKAALGLWPGWEQSGLVLNNSSTTRRMEGLEFGERVLLKDIGLSLSPLKFLVQHQATGSLVMQADLLQGQKTGFFFDQRGNIRMLLEHLERHFKQNQGELAKGFRYLDMFCYVGQWSAQLGKFLIDKGISPDANLADVSASALRLAEVNVRASGVEGVQTLQCDVMKSVSQLGRDFDVVICDPPAFMKKKEDRAPGKAAYLKLNRLAMGLVKRGGYFVSCSCSSLLDGEEFADLLKEAAKKAGREIQWLAQGGPGPDHPVLPQFPEGSYLKARIGRVSQ